jgi:hypothetical protein
MIGMLLLMEYSRTIFLIRWYLSRDMDEVTEQGRGRDFPAERNVQAQRSCGESLLGMSRKSKKSLLAAEYVREQHSVQMRSETVPED